MALNALSDPYLRGLIARLETEAAERPVLYRLRVGALAATGYAFLAGLLLAGSALVLWALTQLATGSTAAAAATLFIGASIIAGSSHALWTRSRRAEGFALSRRDAPALFTLIDKLQKKTEGPKVHCVVIDTQMNAGISQRARLGVLGWYENTLHIGLPFALTVDARGLAATLAHEYGHLSRSRGKWTAWIYRTRRNWSSVGERVAAGGGYFALFLSRPFRWYWPFFNAYSFVLAREHEYEADQVATDLVGGPALANALVGARLAEEFLDSEFWPALYRHADRSPSIGRSPYREMRALLRKIGGHPRARQWAVAAIDRAAPVEDTHPPLRDRLDAMSQRLALPPPVDRSAAKALLGPSLDVLIDHFDREWRTEVRGWWKTRHEESLAARARMDALALLLGQNRASAAEQFEYAGLVERFENWKLAAVAFQNFVERAPKDPRGYYALGRLLVQHDDERGFEALKAAAKLGDDFAVAAARIAVQPLQSRGRVREATKFRENAERVEREDRDFLELAGLLSEADSFAPHGLTSAEYYHLQQLVRRQRGIASALLVRKSLAAYPDRVALVLAIKWSPRFSETAASIESLRQRVQVPYPLIIVEVDDKLAPVIAAIEKVPGCRLS